MNFKHEIAVFKREKEKDGFGGSSYSNEYFKAVKANAAPYEEVLVASAGSIKRTSLLKLFTKKAIELDDFRIEYKDINYKLLSKADYGKVIMYKMERV